SGLGMNPDASKKRLGDGLYEQRLIRDAVVARTGQRYIDGLSSRDGRVTIMMPHPERVFRAVQNSWRPDDWQEDGGWLRMF
ncbi:phosphoribosylformylglycinamidine synthase subunit PurQ, partial [Pseudomonas aeruginosa]|uniref:phosphoribosylformylglycinamidine synthase subunit PurQ n=1 Tax=Pseudomonas aeruginosa TaxID=287 RepID=UPI0020D0ABC1